MPCKSAPPAVHVFAAAWLAESHSSHLIPANPAQEMCFARDARLDRGGNFEAVPGPATVPRWS